MFLVRSTRRAKFSGSDNPSHLAGLKVNDFAHSKTRMEIKMMVNTSESADGRHDERVWRLIEPEIHATRIHKITHNAGSNKTSIDAIMRDTEKRDSLGRDREVGSELGWLEKRFRILSRQPPVLVSYLPTTFATISISFCTAHFNINGIESWKTLKFERQGCKDLQE